MAKEKPAEIRGLFNIPATIISRKILLPKIINKIPRINLKEKKNRRKRIWFTAKQLNCYSEKREWRLTYEKTKTPVLN